MGRWENGRCEDGRLGGWEDGRMAGLEDGKMWRGEARRPVDGKT
jgi:hypothetical protein